MPVDKIVTIFTDGSCNVKNRLGGIGAYISIGKTERFISKGFSDTTVSRMELRAIIEAMRLFSKKDGFSFYFYSDSQYTVHSINKGWLWNWQKANFEGRKNADLWKMFITEYNKFNKERIKFTHVKGHVGIEGNEIADRLANYKQFSEYEKDEAKETVY